MSRDGSSSERLSAAGAATPIWLPDGRLLYVAHTEHKGAFHLVSATGEELMRIPVPPPMTTVPGSELRVPDCLKQLRQCLASESSTA